MDSLSLQQFNDGVNIGFYSVLPAFGSVLFVGVVIFCIKKFFRV